MISTAGLHRRGDRPFSLGSEDYRVIPGDVKANDLVMSHVSTNFDRTGFQQDLNVIFPIDRLREMAERGEIGSIADFISSFLTDIQPQNPNPDFPLAHTLNLATDDLKAIYTEAVTAQPGATGTSNQLADWIYGQTAAGRLLYAIKDKGIQSEDKYLKIVAGALLIPATKPKPPGSDGDYF